MGRARAAGWALVLPLAAAAWGPVQARRPAPAERKLWIDVRYVDGSGPTSFTDALARELSLAVTGAGCGRLTEDHPDFVLQIAIRELREEVDIEQSLADRARMESDAEARRMQVARIEADLTTRLLAGPEQVRAKTVHQSAAYRPVGLEDSREAARVRLIEGLVRTLRSFCCKSIARAGAEPRAR